MTFLSLLLIPALLGVLGFLFSKGKVNIIELAVHQLVILLVVGIGYAIALHSRTSDVETCNGVIAGKTVSNVGCCHPYCCMTCESCSTDSNGNTSCSSYCCMTCYEHSSDVQWDAWTSNNEVVYSNGCNPPGTGTPARWDAIKIGEPTAVEHSYTNYIKGNPDSILRREGAEAQFGPKLPNYPRPYDYYRDNRFLTIGVKLAGIDQLNYRLSEINGKLGAARKVNIAVVVVREADEKYLEALREHWLGGKINDLVVAVGVYDDATTIAWAGVISWTKNEEIKVDIRNAILDLKNLDGNSANQILTIVEDQVVAHFEHRRISEFEYLKASIEPSHFSKVLLTVIGLILAIGMQVFFWLEDPFEQFQTNAFNKQYRY